MRRLALGEALPPKQLRFRDPLESRVARWTGELAGEQAARTAAFWERWEAGKLSADDDDEPAHARYLFTRSASGRVAALIVVDEQPAREMLDCCGRAAAGERTPLVAAAVAAPAAKA